MGKPYLVSRRLNFPAKAVVWIFPPKLRSIPCCHTSTVHTHSHTHSLSLHTLCDCVKRGETFAAPSRQHRQFGTIDSVTGDYAQQKNIWREFNLNRETSFRNIIYKKETVPRDFHRKPQQITSERPLQSDIISTSGKNFLKRLCRENSTENHNRWREINLSREISFRPLIKKT